MFLVPDGNLDEIAAFSQDLLITLRRLPEAQATEGIWALCLLAHIRGPLTLLTTAISHFPAGSSDPPLVDLLRRASPSLGRAEEAPQLLRDAPLHDRYRLAMLHAFSWLPTAGEPAALLPGDPSNAMERWLEDVVRSAADPSGLRTLQDGLPSGAPAQVLTRVVLARSLARRDDGAARHEWALLLQDLEHTKMSHLKLMAKAGLADACAYSDPERARVHYHEMARQAERLGLADTWAVGRAGLWLFLLGDEGAVPWLEQGARERRQVPRRACECALAILRRRGDLRSPAPDVSGLQGRLSEGTSLAQLLETVAHLEALPPETNRQTLPEWQGASDTQAFRVWKRTELLRVL